MKEFWTRLEERERRLLRLAAAVIALALLWGWAWDPLARSRAALRAEAAGNAAALAWMRPAVQQWSTSGARPIGPGVPADGRSLLARVDGDARAAGLAGGLLGVEPLGVDRVRANFSGVDFDALIGWLQSAAGTGLAVEEFSARRAAGPGRVDARVLLRQEPH